MAGRKPPWLDQIRFAAAYYLSGCEAPWSLYAEMAAPTAKNIAAVFLDFGLRDYVKELFRPKGLRSKRHGRKGRKNGKPLPGIPDLNEEAAKRTPGKELLYNRRYTTPTAAFYVVDDVIDRVTWSVALLEMSSDLVYDSLLGVLEHKGEQCASIARMAREGGYHVEGGAYDDWRPVGQGPIKYIVGMNSPSHDTAYMPAGTFSITMGMYVRAPTGPTTFRVRIRDIAPGGPTFAQTEWLEAPTTGHIDVLLNCVVNGPIAVVIEGQHIAGFWDVLHSDWQILEIV